jgi:phosphoinositide-3-kinase, regulatory subunit 4
VVVTVEGSKKMVNDSSIVVVEVWDIEKTILMETFVVRRSAASSDTVHEPHELTGVDADTSPSAAIEALVRSRRAGEEIDKRNTTMPSTQLLPILSADVRAVAVGMEFGGHTITHRSDFADLGSEGTSSRSPWKGFMITGSDDRKIRLWDLGKIERSIVLCGNDSDHERPSYR